MRLRVFNGMMAMLAASCAAAPVCAELYRWVDERGVVTYSDRRPVDARIAEKTQPVPNRISVYAPDQGLLQAVETARLKKSQPEPRGEPDRAVAYTAAAVPQAPAGYDPSGFIYPYPYAVFVPARRRPPPLEQAVLPAGAIAGTINAPGMIPGNTGNYGVNPGPPKPVPRGPLVAPRLLRDPLSPR